jgi:hypothetical protein
LVIVVTIASSFGSTFICEKTKLQELAIDYVILAND